MAATRLRYKFWKTHSQPVAVSTPAGNCVGGAATSQPSAAKGTAAK